MLFILVCLRKAPTQNVQGELFGMCQPVANKWIHRLLPVLNGALAEQGELPSRETLPAPFDVPADTSADTQVSEEDLQSGTFRTLKKLDGLGLNGNKIRYLSPNTFKGLSKLTYLRLSGNNIITFGYGTFKDLAKLTSLYIENNNITNAANRYV